MKRVILILFFIGGMSTFFPPAQVAQAIGPTDFFEVGAAFLTHMAIHESGHYIMAHMGGANEVRLNFFTLKGGNFYLGLSSARGLGRESLLPYKIAGEAAASYHFEVALRSYRAQPTTYNRALLFFSGTDFLWYSIYSLYLSSYRNPNYDPVGVSQETGLSRETILGWAVFQATLNAYRVYSGNDTLIPYFALDKTWAEFGVQMRF